MLPPTPANKEYFINIFTGLTFLLYIYIYLQKEAFLLKVAMEKYRKGEVNFSKDLPVPGTVMDTFICFIVFNLATALR